MGLKHNKKRNVGLLNEFFARYIARCIVEHRDVDLAKAKTLYSRHFQKGSDLHQELRIFTILSETKLTSRESAATLMERTRQMCQAQSQSKLDLEKTALLHEINLTLGDSTFFQQDVSDYRDYATIQVLLNHWRGRLVMEHVGEATLLEDRLSQLLTQPIHEDKPKAILQMSNSEVDGLVVNLMREKLNKKFDSTLNEEQKKLLQLYVFSKDCEETRGKLVERLESLRTRVTSSIDEALAKDPQAKKADSKLLQVRALMQEDFRDTSLPTDRLVTFYMTVSKLETELAND